MKSIKEWMQEQKLMESEGERLNRSHFASFVSGQNFKVNPEIKRKIREKVESILEDPDFKDKSKVEMLKEFMGVISMMIADFDSTSGSVGKITSALNADSEKRRDSSEQIAQEVK